MKGNSENTWNEMIYAQIVKTNAEISQNSGRKSSEKHVWTLNQFLKKVYEWWQGESDIQKAHARTS